MQYQLLTTELLKKLSQEAAALPRLRKNYNFHQLTDNVQRMLNAVEPDSYVRPHRHLNPPKVEHFLVLTGSLAVLIFDDTGNVMETFILSTAGNVRGIDIKPGCWHSLVSLEPGTVIFETKDGPYNAANDKDFAPWAPQENTAAAQGYLGQLKVLALRP